MPSSPRPPITDRRRALRLLADSPSNGHTEAIMLAHGFSPALIVDLIGDDLVTATTERVGGGKQTVEVVRLRITEAGRKALVLLRHKFRRGSFGFLRV